MSYLIDSYSSGNLLAKVHKIIEGKEEKRRKSLYSKIFIVPLHRLSSFIGMIFQDIVGKNKSIRYYFAFSQERRKLKLE